MAARDPLHEMAIGNGAFADRPTGMPPVDSNHAKSGGEGPTERKLISNVQH